MAKVKAAYNYSYNYEGQKISFKKDEEFQLLTKSNKDWWQVRRWMDGCAQDIYVPAVYVKEVETTPVASTTDKEATYMNLDDLKIPKSHQENGTKGAVGGPIVLNKPVKNKKQNSLERNITPPSMSHPPLERRTSTDKEALEMTSSSSTSKPNGLNPARPVSPSMLRRLNKPSTVVATPQQPDNPAPSSSSSSSTAHSSLGSGGGAGQTSSLKRNEGLAPPPISTKPRSRSNADALIPTESTLDVGNRNPQRQPLGPKTKVPPPTKQRPHKAPVPRPVSCMTPGSSSGVTGEAVEKGEDRPSVSQLSNVLLKRNPHLASEHKPLAKSASSGGAETSRVGGASGAGGGVGGLADGLSKSLDLRPTQSPTDTQKNWVSVLHTFLT